MIMSDQPSKPSAAAAPPVEIERDEFGLPIRKIVPLAIQSDPVVTEDRTADESTEGEAADMSKQAQSKTRADADVEKTTIADQRPMDSDDDQFEDAQSKTASDGEMGLKNKKEERPADPKPVGPISAEEATADKSTPSTIDQTPADENTKGPQAPEDEVEESTKSIPGSGQEGSQTLKNDSTSSSQQVIDATVDSDKTAQSNHKKGFSVASDIGMSEFSHQAAAKANIVPEEKQDDDGGWQEMPSYARYDMYNDDDRLVAREHEDSEDEKVQYGAVGGAGKGYTRVIMDEDAESATSMDDNTKYLFNNAAGTSLADAVDDEARDAMSQMQATKDLLTEGQRIAYVGVVRLEIAAIIEEREKGDAPRKVKKELAMSAEATKMWGQKMMIRLYGHMDISEAEQVMIEQLAEHGVVPGDLTPALLKNARVHNPMADADRISEVDDEEEEVAAEQKKDGTEDKPKDVKHAESEQEKGKDSEDAPVPPPYNVDDEKAAAPPPAYEAVGGEELPDVKTPSQLPTTSEIEIDLRWTVLCDLFLILIADSIYDARSRTLMERVGASLDIPVLDICRFEKRVTDALEMQQAADKEDWNEDEHLETRRKQALKKRYMMMGLATVGGGLVIGLSAGLMAPLIGAGLAAGFTTIGLGSAGTTAFLGGVGGAAIITSTAATSGSIIGGRAANRRTGAVKTFEYRPLHNNKRVNLIVTVSGWLTGKMDDVRLPFSTVDPIVGDIYSILWEPEMLRSMGETINILATEALTQGLQQVLGSTILVGLMSAIQLPVILTKLSYLIDNPWAVSLDRAWSAGQILADSLVERSLGTRPITLVGYSIGARVIFSCLQELAKKGAYGIVQNVYMFGSPVVVKRDEYLRARTVVSGRFVNGYHRNDWILGYLFRLTNGGIRRVAGLAKIEECDFVENVDCTEFVKGHMEYRKAMPVLLKNCGFPVESEEFTEIEEPDPEKHGERQRELINEIEEARKQLERDGKAEQNKSRFALFGRRKKMEKAKWEVYEDKGGASDKQKQGEGSESSNTGVLFDIDAIRAELAANQGYGDEEIQVKEIKSTLGPMKIDVPPQNISSSTSSVSLPAERPTSLKDGQTQSLGALTPQHSHSARVSHERGSYGGSPSYLSSPAGRNEWDDDNNDGIQMTFDSSFDDPPPPSVSRAGTAPPPAAAPSAAGKDGSGPSRPEIKTSNTLPNITLNDPWADPDDDDFGKEKEMTMTFA